MNCILCISFSSYVAIHALCSCMIAYSDAFVSPSSFATNHNKHVSHHQYDAQTQEKNLIKFTPPFSTQLFGIPKMFRWLTDQYPNINRRLSEGLTADIHVDNFYLDMNGIIHPCTHGNAEGKVIVLDETAMFKKIFLYVDR